MLNPGIISGILGYIIDKGYPYNTQRAYKSALKKLVKGKQELSKEDIFIYLNKARHPNQRAIINILNQYCLQKGIDFNVVVPQMKQKPRKLPEILSIEEIKLMISAVPRPYDLMLRCIFGMGAGLRISEVLKLQWNNIRWVEWLNNKEYGVAILKETKRDKERVVNIPNGIMEELYDLAKERNILNEFKIPSGGLVFPINVNTFKPELFTMDREKWKYEYIRHAYEWVRHNIIKKVCEKALNKPLHAHMLRHSRATYLYEIEKIPIERIQQLLGHKDLKTTMIYTQVDPRTTFNMMKETKVI